MRRTTGQDGRAGSADLDQHYVVGVCVTGAGDVKFDRGAILEASAIVALESGVGAEQIWPSILLDEAETLAATEPHNTAPATCHNVLSGLDAEMRARIRSGPTDISLSRYGGVQKEDWERWHSERMTNTLKPQIVQADRVDNGVIVSFDGGESFFYSAELLYGMRGSAVNLPDSETDEI
jgi:hypothetical protein